MIKTGYYSQNPLVISFFKITFQIKFKSTKSHRITGPKMTSREDRELGIMKIFKEQVRVSVYIWTQLIGESCEGCLHLDPALFQFNQLSIVLQALETTQDPKSLCVLMSGYHHPRQE